ncbi:CPBP family intramembrane metalloprotease [Lentibacillus halophilus]|uniref:CPBP family intramembrane metalloprotease n=1 Tax=Lentibacillus halophilus TaxID=295065 RepID=A0ABN0Z3S6_9BACI
MAKRYWYVILTYIIMQFSGLLFVPLLWVLTPLSRYDATIYWSVISFLIGLVVVLWLLRPDMKQNNSSQAAGVGRIILWSAAGLVMAYISNSMASSIERVLFGVDPTSQNTEMIMDITRSVPVFAAITTIIAPILEEIVFRKIIFGELYKRMNFFIAAVLSALIFSVIHMELAHTLVYASMGFVFAFVYVKTKRIIVPIIVHMAMNSISVLVLTFGADYIENKLKQLEDMQTILFPF